MIDKTNTSQPGPIKPDTSGQNLLQEDQGLSTTIRELIQSKNVSVRLQNGILNNAELPYNTVEEYITTQKSVRKYAFKSLKNFGEKTFNELEDVIQCYLEEGQTDLNFTYKNRDAPELYTKIISFLDDIPFRESILLFEVNEKIIKALSFMEGIHSLKNYVENWVENRDKLMNLPAFGRTSLYTLENIIQKIIKIRYVSILNEKSQIEQLTLENIFSKTLLPNVEAAISSYSSSLDEMKNWKIEDHLNDLEDRTISTTERIFQIIEKLPRKESDIIHLRYGLKKFSPMKIEEIGVKTGYSKERTRQTVVSGINRLRVPVNCIEFKNLLHENESELWHELSEGSGFLLPMDLERPVVKKRSIIKLAIDVTHNSIDGWLDSTGQNIFGGWLKSNINPDDFKADVQKLDLVIRNYRYPQPLESASKLIGMDVLKLRRAVRAIEGFNIFDEYLISGNNGKISRRTIRLHSISQELQGEGLLDFEVIQKNYTERYPEEKYHIYIFERCMNNSPHLFKQLFDNYWTAIPFIDQRIEKSLPNILINQYSMDGKIINDHDDEPIVETMLTEEQCRLYTKARSAGDPLFLFAGWSFRFEQALCFWAWKNSPGKAFSSLLSVIKPEEWDCSSTDKEYWALMSKRHGSNELSTVRHYTFDNFKPHPDHLLAALLTMQTIGGLSWISYNRASNNYLASHQRLGGFALLIALNCIQPENFWQDRHFPGPQAGKVLSTFSEILTREGLLTWDQPEIVELLNNAQSNMQEGTLGWVDPVELQNLIQLIKSEKETSVIDVDPDDPKLPTNTNNLQDIKHKDRHFPVKARGIIPGIENNKDYINSDSPFGKVILSYDSLATNELRTRNRSADLRQIRFDHWPHYIHYEFIDYRGTDQIAVELHLENDNVKFLGKILQKFAGIIIEGEKITWDEKWSINRGRIGVRFSIFSKTETIVRAMNELIVLTSASVDDNMNPISTTDLKR